MVCCSLLYYSNYNYYVYEKKLYYNGWTEENTGKKESQASKRNNVNVWYGFHMKIKWN